jgi:arabinoxylan arabinofuranohydrolase
MYDVYTTGKYQFTKSSDLIDFHVIDDEVSMNFHPRHGSVLSITKREMRLLIKEFGRFDKSMIESLSNKVKTNNIDVNVKGKTNGFIFILQVMVLMAGQVISLRFFRLII